jgi:hypothetical protein
MKPDVAEDFTWSAVYRDGSVLPERDPDGTEHGWAEIDQDRLDLFALMPQRPGLPSPVLKLSPAVRPIFFRRRVVTLDPDGGPEQTRTITVLGFATTVEQRAVKAFVAVYPDGSVLISDQDNFW